MHKYFKHLRYLHDSINRNVRKNNTKTNRQNEHCLCYVDLSITWHNEQGRSIRVD